MFLQGFGEILTTALTVNPELSSVPTASSILDTSNYTFHAVTYGKDAEGYNFHGHSVSTVQRIDEESDGAVSGYNDDAIVVVNYRAGITGLNKSYNASAAHDQFSATYISLPAYPAVSHTRLEPGSTQTTNASAFSATPPDLGHYPNAWGSSSLSNAWTILGGFAPPSAAGKYIKLVQSDGTVIESAIVSGVYNQNGVVDKDGYVKVSQVSGLNGQLGADGQGFELSGGSVIFSSTASSVHPSAGNTAMAIVPQHGDGAALAAYGGINHFGIYCLDLNTMLASSINPPYAYDALNNNRIYKLVSKVSFWDSVINQEDLGPTGGLLGGLNPGVGLTNLGPTYVLKFNFL